VSEGRLPGVRITYTPLHTTPLSVLTAYAALADGVVRERESAARGGSEAPHSLEALLPAPLLAKLMPFQLEGVQFALRSGGRALFGDQMGLGKTVQVSRVEA